jgi:CDGSH-type Zn-finger protein
MGACGCGYSTDPEKNCNGTHNVVKAVKADLIAKLEADGFIEAVYHLNK